MATPKRNIHYPKSGERGTPQAFPYKVREMLEEGGDERRAIISWNPTGTAFSIFDKDALQADVLGRHFNSPKYDSFKRQLNQYGFQELPADSDSAQTFARVFAHPSFIRDQPGLLYLVSRKPQPGRKPQSGRLPGAYVKPRAYVQVAEGECTSSAPVEPVDIFTSDDDIAALLAEPGDPLADMYVAEDAPGLSSKRLEREDMSDATPEEPVLDGVALMDTAYRVGAAKRARVDPKPHFPVAIEPKSEGAIAYGKMLAEPSTFALDPLAESDVVSFLHGLFEAPDGASLLKLDIPAPSAAPNKSPTTSLLLALAPWEQGSAIGSV